MFGNVNKAIRNAMVERSRGEWGGVVREGMLPAPVDVVKSGERQVLRSEFVGIREECRSSVAVSRGGFVR